MKTLLEVTSGFDANNAAEMVKLNNLIEHYTHANKCEVEGVSLITVRDLVRYSDDKLRENGYVLTLTQFKEDCKKYLELAAKDPILYNSRLKRLHKSYATFEAAYVAGRVYNKSVLEEMHEHFSKSLRHCYSHGDYHGKKMPIELAQRISTMVDAEIINFNKMWIANEVSADLAREYTKIFDAQFITDWRKGLLPQCISQSLENEKGRLNSVERLLHHFRANQLTTEIKDLITEKVVSEIRGDITAKRINQNNALGSAIIAVKNNLLNPENFEVISELISQWRKGDLSPEAKQIFEQRISEIIEKMKPSLERDFSDQFDRLTAENFLRNIQNGAAYSKDVVEAMQGYALSLTKPALLVSVSDSANESPCKNVIYNEVMKKLNAQLICKELAEVECTFIKEIVFSELRLIDSHLSHQVWVGHSANVMQQLRVENDSLRAEVTRLADLVNQVIQSQPGSIKPAQNLDAKADDKSGLMSGYGLFGKK